MKNDKTPRRFRPKPEAKAKAPASKVKRHTGPLSGRQRRHLRGLGHHLHPVVIVGQNGITPQLLGAVRQALNDHELIKVKVGADDRQADAETLAQETGAELAQLLGRTALLFKQHPHKPKLDPNPPRAEKPKGKKGRGAPRDGGGEGIVEVGDDDLVDSEP